MADNQPTVMITMSLANAILTHLKNGGNRLEADMLGEHLFNQCSAPAVEAARQKEIRDAVAQSKIDAALKMLGKVPAAEVVPEPELAPVLPRAPRKGRR